MDYKNLEMLTWLVSQLRKAGKRGITYNELSENLKNDPAMNMELHKRTFHNYIKELRCGFGIRIECDRELENKSYERKISEYNKRYRYRLVYEPRSGNVPWTMPFLWTVETASAMKYLRDTEDAEKYIYIDNEPTGSDKVDVLLEAIRQHRRVDLMYRDPKDPRPLPYNGFEPRGLVMKNFIWYLLGNTLSRGNRIWPLYRISDIRITDTECRTEFGFSPKKFWNDFQK